VGSDGPRVVVTGAAGFVGLNLVERLLTLGLDTVAVDAAALPDGARNDFDRLPGSLHEAVADVTDPSAIVAALAGADVVIHCAAITSGAERERRDARRIIEVNVIGTQTVLDAVAAVGTVRRVVYVSSGAIYGDRVFGSLPVDEATPPEPASLYAITKLTGEQLVRLHGELHGTEVVTARVSAVFGPWERDTGVRDSISPMYLIARAHRQGVKLVAGRYAPRNWLYARDAAAALSDLALMPQPAHDVYNVTPTEWFEPMRWARRLGLVHTDSNGRDDGAALLLPLDDRNPDTWAPVANARLCAELDGWPAFGADEALADYAAWLETHHSLG